MEQEKFLSEEKYQETNKKVNNTSKILLTIGIILLVVGVIITITGFVRFAGKPMNVGQNDQKTN